MTNTTNSMNLTPASLAVFVRHAKDAGNWNGCPMLDITKEERGNLTDLKAKGLVTTSKDEGIEWVFFTDTGKAFAASMGITIVEGW
jgi:hypothetical protein